MGWGQATRAPDFPRTLGVSSDPFALSFQTLKGKELSSNPCSATDSLIGFGNLSAALSLSFLISEMEMILPPLSHLCHRAV